VKRVLALLFVIGALPVAAPPAVAADPPPVFAYYYIWFNASSWNRRKVDYPLIGRYSSDEERVMREQIRSAKRAGLDGFIVSWKSTPQLDRRLAVLARLADQEDFKLAVIYQGLNYARDPLPTRIVRRDLARFSAWYGSDRAFHVFRRPIVIWSGTWRFSRGEIASVTRPLRRKLLILASEHDANDYERVADVVEGNAYYWSSANPSTYPGYPGKLEALGRAVHGRSGLWIAPAAPGFDGRLIGGHTVVPRRGGTTLRLELNAALKSDPDVVGLISWNEFSEGTHIEPSRRYGNHFLRVFAQLRDAHVPPAVYFSDEGDPATGLSYATPLFGGAVLLFIGGLFVVAVRRSRRAGA
jgi:hypothetical protein